MAFRYKICMFNGFQHFHSFFFSLLSWLKSRGFKRSFALSLSHTRRQNHSFSLALTYTKRHFTVAVTHWGCCWYFRCHLSYFILRPSIVTRVKVWFNGSLAGNSRKMFECCLRRSSSPTKHQHPYVVSGSDSYADIGITHWCWPRPLALVAFAQWTVCMVLCAGTLVSA